MTAPLVEAGHVRSVELVVTDIIGSQDDGLTADRGARCTIPLAVLDDEVPLEAMRELARSGGPSASSLISANELVQLLTQLFESLRRGPDAAGQQPGADEADLVRVCRLTPRERQVLQHVVAGDPNKRTANMLNISRRTVEHHRASIMHKTRTKSVSELVCLALRTGLAGARESGRA